MFDVVVDWIMAVGNWMLRENDVARVDVVGVAELTFLFPAVFVATV